MSVLVWLEQGLPSVYTHQNPLEGLLQQLGATPRGYGSVGLCWSPRARISNKYFSNADTPGPGTTPKPLGWSDGSIRKSEEGKAKEKVLDKKTKQTICVWRWVCMYMYVHLHVIVSLEC